MPDDEDDSINYLLELIESGYLFSNKSWVGGVRAKDIKVKDKGKISIDEDVAEFIASHVECQVTEEMSSLSKIVRKLICSEIRKCLGKKNPGKRYQLHWAGKTEGCVS